MPKISELYTKENSDYSRNMPTWDVDDSPWKAKNILNLLKKHAIEPKTIAEIGCGAGEILNQLYGQLPENVEYFGYDISPDAIKLAKTREKPRLSFFNEDLLLDERRFDLLLMIDVCEHVENYYDFITRCAKKANYMVLGIPLDISVRTIIRNKNLTVRRNLAGHVHFFNSQSALLMLENCDLEMIDSLYRSRISEEKRSGKIRIFADMIVSCFLGKRWAADIIGDYTLYSLVKCPHSMDGP